MIEKDNICKTTTWDIIWKILPDVLEMPRLSSMKRIYMLNKIIMRTSCHILNDCSLHQA